MTAWGQTLFNDFRTLTFQTATAGGTADAITVTLAPIPPALLDGFIIWMKATADNTSTTPTLDINGLGAKTVVKNDGSALAAADIKNNAYHILKYDLGLDKFRLLFSGGGGGGTPCKYLDYQLTDIDGVTKYKTDSYTVGSRVYADDGVTELATGTYNITEAWHIYHGSVTITVGVNDFFDYDTTSGGITLIHSNVWQPTDLPNCKIWIKADTNITKDGSDHVRLVGDQSGQGNDFSQGTGSCQPLWVDNQLNGLPILRFDGINDFLSCGDVLDLHTNSWSMFIVYKKTTSNFCNIIGKTNFVGDQEYEIFSMSLDGISIYSAPGFYTSSFSVSQSQTSFLLVEAIQNRSIFQQPRYVYVNGNLIGSDSQGYTINDFDTALNFTIGSRSNGDYNFAGDIAEIILYFDFFTDTDRQKVESYLKIKYGL
jgi:hypothetical protein